MEIHSSYIVGFSGVDQELNSVANRFPAADPVAGSRLCEMTPVKDGLLPPGFPGLEASSNFGRLGRAAEGGLPKPLPLVIGQRTFKAETALQSAVPHNFASMGRTSYF